MTAAFRAATHSICVRTSARIRRRRILEPCVCESLRKGHRLRPWLSYCYCKGTRVRCRRGRLFAGAILRVCLRWSNVARACLAHRRRRILLYVARERLHKHGWLTLLRRVARGCYAILCRDGCVCVHCFGRLRVGLGCVEEKCRVFAKGTDHRHCGEKLLAEGIAAILVLGFECGEDLGMFALCALCCDGGESENQSKDDTRNIPIKCNSHIVKKPKSRNPCQDVYISRDGEMNL